MALIVMAENAVTQVSLQTFLDPRIRDHLLDFVEAFAKNYAPGAREKTIDAILGKALELGTIIQADKDRVQAELEWKASRVEATFKAWEKILESAPTFPPQEEP
jgi:hypothetical protein